MYLVTGIILDRLQGYCAEQDRSLCFYEISHLLAEINFYFVEIIYLVTTALSYKEINIISEDYKGYEENEAGRYLG